MKVQPSRRRVAAHAVAATLAAVVVAGVVELALEGTASTLVLAVGVTAAIVLADAGALLLVVLARPLRVTVGELELQLARDRRRAQRVQRREVGRLAAELDLTPRVPLEVVPQSRELDDYEAGCSLVEDDADDRDVVEVIALPDVVQLRLEPVDQLAARRAP